MDRTDTGLNLSRPSNASAASILDGVNAIIDRHLGCLDIGTSAPHFAYKTACLRLSATPLPNLGVGDLVREIGRTIQSNWLQSDRQANQPTAANWRFEAQLRIAHDNQSDEKTLEKAIARLLPDWVNQVPTASGLASSGRDRHRNIDLVHRVSPGEFEFVELKIDNDNPLMAAMELLQYFALFLFARHAFPSFSAQCEVLNARIVHLSVLAPQRFYDAYDLRWLEQELGRGFAEVATDHGVSIDFRFLAFADDFRLPCPDHLLDDAVARRMPPRWIGENLPNLRQPGFVQRMRTHQQHWAQSESTIGDDRLDRGHGPESWVLSPKHAAANFFDPSWMKFVTGFEHKWLRSLISSQCLAVNLFAPLAEDSDRALAVLKALLPDRNLLAGDQVSVAFEQTPVGAAQWLGERRQPTQVDALFTIRRSGQSIGFVLVEVKFTELDFGGCRGWQGSKLGEPQNPDRNRCLDLLGVLQNPTGQCWMAEREGRRYWEIMGREDSSMRLRQLPAGSPCPFRHGLYQIMRNRALADCMRRELGAQWADVAVCLHPGNKAVRQQPEQFAGTLNSVEQFQAITGPQSLRDWDAGNLLDAIQTAGASVQWGEWMRRRYKL
jgi:hypothetical protein